VECVEEAMEEEEEDVDGEFRSPVVCFDGGGAGEILLGLTFGVDLLV